MQRLLLVLLLVGVLSAQEYEEEYITQNKTNAIDCACGVAKRGRIVGGNQSRANAYPFMAALTLSNKRPFCGATIITSEHALTTAHCTNDLKHKLKEMYVLVGAHDIRKAVTDQFISVFNTFEHPSYKSEGDNSFDIAIIVLEMALKPRKDVLPSCLLHKWIDLDNFNVLLTGWGITRKDGPISPVLKEVVLNVLPWENCHRFYPQEVHKFKSQFCSYGKEKDACQGDSGGPLMVFDSSIQRYVVVGLVSFGRACASGSPTINTHIGFFLDWIRGVVKATSMRGSTICSKKS